MANTEKKKGMNLLDYFMLGFGSIVGVGWAVAVNGWMGTGGGPIPSAIAYIFATLMIIPISFCYAELTSAMPVAGGVVAFAYKAYGSFASFVGGWFVALAYVTIIPWEAIYINDVLALIFPVLKAGDPLYMIAGTGIYANGLIVGVIVSLAVIFMNYRGIDIAAGIQTALGFILVGSGILVILFCFLKADPANLMPVYQNVGKGTHTTMLGGMIAVMSIAPFFLAGFDTITQGAEDSESGLDYNGLGKVLVMAILSAGIFYTLVIISSGLAMPWTDFFQLPRPAVSLELRDAYGGVLGAGLYWLVMIGALAGLFTTWNGFFIASARLLMGMSRARLIPAFFSKIHPKYGTPVGANTFIAISCLIGPFVGMGVIDPLTVVGSTAFLIGWFMTSICTIKLRTSQPDMPRPYKAPGGMGLIWIAAIFSLLFIVSTFLPFSPGYMGTLGVQIFIVWAIVGIIFYAASAKFRNEFTEEEKYAAIFQKLSK